MLPGFRFLFAAIVLSMSVLIFGLGAAALLRATHEEFASITSRRPPPEIVFAQQGDVRPTLAILRVEPSAAEEIAAEPEKPAAEPDTIAASTDVTTSVESAAPLETPKSEAIASEVPVQAEAASEAPAPAIETKVAAIAEAPSQTAATAPERENAPIDDSTRIAETKIATLGGPPVTIETQAPSKLAPAVVKKSVQAKRVVKRRRIAQRSRVAGPVPQQPANPFGSPQIR
jgi:hypothetical protein